MACCRPLPTIACLVAVSALTVWLAVRNDSQPLAGLAIAGGFLAPMLVDAGGEPLQLFGYFAVLNGAIFALAWTRAWRALNASASCSRSCWPRSGATATTCPSTTPSSSRSWCSFSRST